VSEFREHHPFYRPPYNRHWPTCGF